MIIKAAWVIPVSSPPIRSGYVEVCKDRIVAVGDSREIPDSIQGITDLGDAVLIPGLVNPHTHLELCCYANQLEPAGFWEWIERLIRLRATPGQLEREQAAVTDGAWQSLRAGVTCVGDISRSNCAWSALKPLPIRKVCFVELLTLADLPPRNPEELRRAVAEVVEDDLLTVGITPHTPYSVPADQVRAAIALADEYDRPWTMHLAETREEVAFLRGEQGALSPTIEQLLDQCGVVSPGCSPGALLADCSRGMRKGSLAHTNYLEEVEFARLVEGGHAVIYCPRSHHFFGHSPHPFVRMLQAGVTVTIGTDSLASNYSLSILEELRQVHTRIENSPGPEELLRMATLDAALALGFERLIGSLGPEKQADLAAFACSPETSDPITDLIENPRPAAAVWVAGQRVI